MDEKQKAELPSLAEARSRWPEDRRALLRVARAVNGYFLAKQVFDASREDVFSALAAAKQYPHLRADIERALGEGERV